MRILSVAFVLLGSSTCGVAADAPDGSIFNGKDFSGWKTKGDKKAPSEPLDGKPEAFGGRFKAIDGILTIDPKVKGDRWIETAQEFSGDLTVRFEFKPGPGCNNDTMFRGVKFDLKKSDIKNLKEGEWNAFEIVAVGSKLDYRCNGESIKAFTAKAAKGTFALRAEFGPLQIRNLRVTEGK